MNSTWDRGVVVGVDGSPESLTALDWAASTATRHDARLTVLAAYEPEQDPTPGLQVKDIDVRAAADEALRRAADRLGEVRPGGHAAELLTAVGSPSALLAERSRTSDLVVLGRRGLGRVSRALLGSASGAVVARAHGPVVVIPAETGAHGPERVVAGVDRPEDAGRVLERAFAEAESCGCRLDVVHALDVSLLGDGLREYETFEAAERTETHDRLEQEIRKWSEKFPGVRAALEVRGGPAASVLLHGASPSDLVVVGGRRHSRVAGRILGSVADRVVREATCPVMVIKVG
ncbi:universal stress protein [Myceligenerans cantabricum]